MYPIPEFDGPFSELLPQFITYKRSLGYDYGKSIVCRLAEMNRFLIAKGVTEIEISKPVFQEWVSLKSNEAFSTQEKRYIAIHCFAKFLILNGYKNVYIQENPVIKRDSSFIPYIYSEDEIQRLFRAADHFTTEKKAYAYDHSTMFPVLLRLLYSTGLRISEALSLRLRDVEFQRGNIMIWDSKNHVSRMVSVSASLINVLRKYSEKMHFVDENNFMFQGYNGSPYSYTAVNNVFHKVLNDAGISRRASGKLPRIHDLRHVFAIRALEQMQAKGYDLYTSLPLLSKYLGHKSIVETEYYIRLTQSSFSQITRTAGSYSPDLFPNLEGE